MQRRVRVWSAVLATALAAGTVAGPGHAAGSDARSRDWRPAEDIRGPAATAVLPDGTTVIISAGGKRGKELFEQRRAADGSYSERVSLGPVELGRYCVPALVDVQQSTIGLVVDCQAPFQFEDPPSTTVEMVWTEATGWAAESRRKSEPTGVDVSPNGDHVVFTTDNEYFGRPSHVSTYDVGVGWADHTWAERPHTDDVLRAAVDDSGAVEVVRTTGFEDEPGAWIGGTVELMHYDEGEAGWVRDFIRKGHGIGVTQADADASSDGTLLATYVRHFGSRAEVWALRASDLSNPTIVQAGPRSRDVYGQQSAMSGDGWGQLVWQQQASAHTYQTFFKRWRPLRDEVTGHRLDGRYTPSQAVEFGGGFALSENGGQITVAWAGHADGSPTTKVFAIQGAQDSELFPLGEYRRGVQTRLQVSQGTSGRAALLMSHWHNLYTSHRAALGYDRSASAP